MITIDEWNNLVDLYKSSIPSLSNKGSFVRASTNYALYSKVIKDHNKIRNGAYHLLLSYTGHGYMVLNEQLMETNLVPCDQPIQVYADLLIRALDMLPKFNNNTCYRNTGLDSNAFNYLKKRKGGVIMIPYFCSTSFVRTGNVGNYFEIHTDNLSDGHYIGNFVERPVEQEILFKPNTCFEIIDYDRQTIYLEEVKAEQYDLALYYSFWRKNYYSERAYDLIHLNK